MPETQTGNAAPRKRCFVIAPIGAVGSEARQRSDDLFAHLVEPVVRSRGFEPQRADQLGKPGLITSQVMQRLIDDDLVIADLSGSNANVFYELALRHAVKKPVILLMVQGEKIPFDVAQSRTIYFDYSSWGSLATAKTELERQIQAIQSNPSDFDNPISVAVDLRALREAGDAGARIQEQILSELQSVRSRLGSLEAPKQVQISTPFFGLAPSLQGSSGVVAPLQVTGVWPPEKAPERTFAVSFEHVGEAGQTGLAPASQKKKDDKAP